jgi:hypothetical protein
MIKKCPNCGYKTRHAELTSSSKCQICGIVYSRYEKVSDMGSSGPAKEKLTNKIFEEPYTFKNKESRFIWGLLIVFWIFSCLLLFEEIKDFEPSFNQFYDIISNIIFRAIIFILIPILIIKTCKYFIFNFVKDFNDNAVAVGQKIAYEKISNKMKINKYIQSIPEFSMTASYVTDNHKAFIAVDEERKTFVIGGVDEDTVNYKIISTKDILGVEITESGKGLLSSSDNINTLGMAAAGGLLFGGAGAVVGALSGSNTKSRTTEISLRIAIDNIKIPYVGINFLTEVVGKGSNAYQQALENAEKWFGIVKILLAREKKERGQNSESIKINRTT